MADNPNDRLLRLERAQLLHGVTRRRPGDILDRHAARRTRLEDADGDL